jgi:hypothetical protein
VTPTLVGRLDNELSDLRLLDSDTVMGVALGAASLKPWPTGARFGI